MFFLESATLTFKQQLHCQHVPLSLLHLTLLDTGDLFLLGFCTYDAPLSYNRRPLQWQMWWSEERIFTIYLYIFGHLVTITTPAAQNERIYRENAKLYLYIPLATSFIYDVVIMPHLVWQWVSSKPCLAGQTLLLLLEFSFGGWIFLLNESNKLVTSSSNIMDIHVQWKKNAAVWVTDAGD